MYHYKYAMNEEYHWIELGGSKIQIIRTSVVWFLERLVAFSEA